MKWTRSPSHHSPLVRFGLDQRKIIPESTSEFERFFQRYFTPSHRQFCHYTSITALVSILDSKRFWLTNINYLNDAEEYSHAYQVLNECLAESAARASDLQRTWIENVGRMPEGRFDENVFVICFSTKWDDLNQWRSYAGISAGCCITYTRSTLQGFADSNEGVLGACIYDRSLQRRVIGELVSEFISDLQGYFPLYGTGEINEDLVTARTKTFHSYFQRMAPFFKHPAFEEEQEVRVVVRPRKADTVVSYRASHDVVVPYLDVSQVGEIGSSVAPISVLVSPSPRNALRIQSLRRFFSDKGMYSVDVCESSIPYREAK